MKTVFLLALIGAWSALAVRADDASKMTDLGTYFNESKDVLKVQLTGDHDVWQNGRLISQPYPNGGMMNQALLKPGDIIISAAKTAFYATD